jgi:hypothetical protein
MAGTVTWFLKKRKRDHVIARFFALFDASFWQQFWANLFSAVAIAVLGWLLVKARGAWQTRQNRSESKIHERREQEKGSEPVVVIDYELRGAHRNPDERRQRVRLRNVGHEPAFEITISAIQGVNLVATFDAVPTLAPGDPPREVRHYISGGSPAFVGDLVSVLDEAHSQRRPSSLSGLFVTVPIPVQVEYRDVRQRHYRSLHEIRFTGFYKGVTTVFLSVESTTADSGI